MTSLATTAVVVSLPAMLLGVSLVLPRHLRLRRQVDALQRAVETTLTSAPPATWASPPIDGSLGPLGEAIGRLGQAITARCEQSSSTQHDAERQQQENLAQQLRSERYLRHQAQTVLDEITSMITSLLGEVVQQAQQTLTTTTTIDGSVRSVHDVTQSVIDRTRTADSAVKALEQSLQRVGGIAGFIATVADQTNLLSLNATIEAARAGQAGKGFGVVAHEVKELATTTSRSTSQISETIDALKEEAARMTSAVTGIVEGISAMGDATTNLETLGSEQRGMVEGLGASVHEALGQMELLMQLTHEVERRQHQRAAVAGRARFVWAGDQGADVDMLDLSEGGLRGQLDRSVRLTVGTSVEAHVPVRDKVLRIPAEVLWRRPDEQRDQIGLSFTQIGASDAATIGAFVHASLMSVENFLLPTE